MLSVRDTILAAHEVSAENEQCSCTVPLVLSNTKLFLYEQMKNIRSRETSGVVTKLTGNSQDSYPQLKSHALYVCAACSGTPCSAVQLAMS